MSSWRDHFAELSKKQMAAFDEDNIETLMTVGEEVTAAVRAHTAAGKPNLESEIQTEAALGALDFNP